MTLLSFWGVRSFAWAVNCAASESKTRNKVEQEANIDLKFRSRLSRAGTRHPRGNTSSCVFLPFLSIKRDDDCFTLPSFSNFWFARHKITKQIATRKSCLACARGTSCVCGLLLLTSKKRFRGNNMENVISTLHTAFPYWTFYRLIHKRSIFCRTYCSFSSLQF